MLNERCKDRLCDNKRCRSRVKAAKRFGAQPNRHMSLPLGKALRLKEKSGFPYASSAKYQVMSRRTDRGQACARVLNILQAWKRIGCSRPRLEELD